MAETAMRMKQERAKLQYLIVAQARAASERFAEADRVRDAKLQRRASWLVRTKFVWVCSRVT
ncbi:hypothetical protein FRC02_003345 [Tulasnella sp. 418]|nr:hypothetical protein FRC02_003345 [Tulasnella sp. 418]